MSDDERRISGDRLDLMRSALEAYAMDNANSDDTRVRAAVRDAVLVGSTDLARLADLFNDLAEAPARGGT